MNTIEETRYAANTLSIAKHPRKYYVLDAAESRSHVEHYNSVKAAALHARDLLTEKYKCTGMLLRGPCGIALTFKRDFSTLGSGLAGCKSKKNGDTWESTPLKNTKLGKAIQAELDAVAELQETWQWALETSLGVYCSVFGYMPEKGFHHTFGSILPDGRVLLSVPNDTKATSLVPQAASEITMVEWLEFDAGSVQ